MKFWDWYAGVYSRVEELGPHRQMREDVLSLIPAGAQSVLDVGCGSGALLAELRAQRPTCELYGLDASGSMLAAAVGRVAGLHVIQADMDSDWAGCWEVDCVVLCNSLYAASSPEKVLEQAMRVARRRVVVCAPHARSSGMAVLHAHCRAQRSYWAALWRFSPCLLCNLWITLKSKAKRYHFREPRVPVRDGWSVAWHPNTFADQNYLMTLDCALES